jgi:hypothetical protein
VVGELDQQGRCGVNNKRLFVKLTAVERDRLNALARILRVSRSEVVRALVLHTRHAEVTRCVQLQEHGVGGEK